MAQHDYDIANDTAANVRADINNALEAIATTNSGSSAPSTTYANQLWYDTTNNILKIRNEVDTAWINLVSLDQSGGTSTAYTGSTAYGVLDEDDMSSDSATDLPTQQSTKAYVDRLFSTVNDVTASRAANTTYTNSTGRPMLVLVKVEVLGGSGNSFFISGTGAVSGFEDADTGFNFRATHSVIVPDGEQYLIDAPSSIVEWTEIY